MIHVVLGMHKSGTTLISECLHHSGIAMVEAVHEEAGYDTGQKWEREATKALNQRMLGTGRAHSLAVGGAEVKVADTGTQHEMHSLLGVLSQAHPAWGFKDPRTCLTYEAWARVLPPHKIVGVYRDPQSVLDHYRKQAAADSRAFDARLVITRWCEYNLAIVRALQGAGRSGLLICYDDFMRDGSEFMRLQAFLGRPLIDRRQVHLQRSRPAPVNTGWRSLVGRLWQGGYRIDRVHRQLEALRST